MNVTKCENGHFFDIETYEKCPHCGAGVFSIDGKGKGKNKPAGEAPEKSPGSLRFKEKTGSTRKPENSEPDRHVQPAHARPITSGGQLNSATILLDEDDWEEEGKKEAPEIRSGISPIMPAAMEKPNVVWQHPGGQQEKVQMQTPPKPVSHMQEPPVQAQHVAEPKPMKTIGVFQNMRSEPVTGWLVCIEGETQGESYNIVSGNNRIGRNINMDICIADPSVSGENQAILTFDPRSQNYFIKPGEGKALMYFNDEEDFFDERRKLKAYDKLVIGNAKFVFVPLCGEKFTWNDYLKDAKGDE